MAIEVKMPQLGESVTEGTVGKWLKGVGDEVKKYEPLLEVITDKVDTEITATHSGTVLQILINEGETVPVGTVLAVLGAEGEGVPEAAPIVEEAAAKPARAPRISPVVAKIAAEHNVDLSLVKGTGRGGRVTKKDILAYIEARKAAPPVEAPPAVPPPAAPPPAPPPIAAPAIGDQILELTPMRAAIAEHMVRSHRVAPHVTSVIEVDMSRVVAFREARKEEFQRREGINLTYTTFLVQAAVVALKAYPIVNSTWAEDKIILKKRINIGIAVALPDGLIVPVIKDADEKSLLRLAREVNDLSQRAREKRLTPDDVQGGTFTITNPGMYGSLFGTPIIHQPQAAILGVGAIARRVVVVDDAIAIRPMVYISLTIDHRILDGAIADQFLSKIREHLERGEFGP